MPTYVYRRADGTTFEVQQRITEPALETCPTTGQQVKRVISGSAGLIFKGSGFYLTDYAHKNGSTGNGSNGNGSNGHSNGSSNDSKATSSATETKAAKSCGPGCGCGAH